MQDKNRALSFLDIFRISLASGGSSSGSSDSERQTELDIKCLQILRAVIYNKTILIDEEDKERNPPKYRELVINVQSLNFYYGLTLIITIFCIPAKVSCLIVGPLLQYKDGLN